MIAENEDDGVDAADTFLEEDTLIGILVLEMVSK